MAAKTQTGIAISVKAWLPLGDTMREQRDTLDRVLQAHESGDYVGLLQNATIDEIKAEQRNRRVGGGDEPDTPEEPEQGQQGGSDAPEQPPEFLRKNKRSAE